MSDLPPLHPSKARFYELDILRGVAAVLVVFYHYKHFLLISEAAGFDYADLPFQDLLMPLYLYGQFFVELFFAISGYVFFWLYADAIKTRRTGPVRFFIARFARLYPLYFVTLVAAAVLQIAYTHVSGASFIYSDNTSFNFVLSLFMVQQWWPGAVQTFNGPAWSISVEVFLYALFFLICYLRRTSYFVLLLLIVIGLTIKDMDALSDFARGMPHFFIGGLVFYLVQWLRADGREKIRKAVTIGLGIVLPVLAVISFVRGRVPGQLHGNDLVSTVFSVDSFIYIFLPLFLLQIGLMQGHWKVSLMSRETLHRWSWIGDISYAVYLIHFPLQLAMMLILSAWPAATRLAIFSSPITLIGFMGTACGLAWLSHRYFEMPMQRFLRGWMGERLDKPKALG
ncbi:acyltransferase family protein [Asticcacaulis sp. AC466]|uniref:acyltransferase family protein n=1 Tax=Asticcacaulis sp. AC466 TaxID=1282362 RepID=UPI0004109F6D|nr:acyltransferase [Asticcacaulis sp. AC466]